jgi:hypothetical protein
MSLLDQLAKQAEARKQNDPAAELAQREAQFDQLCKAFEKFKDYLEQLTSLLSKHPETVVQNYEIPGYGTLQANIAHDYVVRHTPAKNSVELSVSVNAMIASDSQALVVHGASKVQTVKSLFDKHKITAIQDTKKDASNLISQATFKPRGKLPLSIVCTAELANPQMKMLITNFEDLGQSTKQFSLEQIDDAFFDLVGHYIARKDNELTKEKLPDGVLKKLRHTAQQNEMRRRWEEKLAAQAAAAEAAREEAERQNKLGAKVLETGKSLLGRLGSLIKKNDK